MVLQNLDVFGGSNGLVLVKLQRLIARVDDGYVHKPVLVQYDHGGATGQQWSKLGRDCDHAAQKSGWNASWECSDFTLDEGYSVILEPLCLVDLDDASVPWVTYSPEKVSLFSVAAEMITMDEIAALDDVFITCFSSQSLILNVRLDMPKVSSMTPLAALKLGLFLLRGGGWWQRAIWLEATKGIQQTLALVSYRAVNVVLGNETDKNGLSDFDLHSISQMAFWI